jgi:hypothetical protein
MPWDYLWFDIVEIIGYIERYKKDYQKSIWRDLTCDVFI